MVGISSIKRGPDILFDNTLILLNNKMDICGCSKTQFPLINSRIGNVHLKTVSGSRKMNLEPGDRVVLVYAPSIDFVEALAGCLLVGIVPVAIMPPDPMGNDAKYLHQVCDNANAKAILTHKIYQRGRLWGRIGQMARLKSRIKWPDLPWVVTDSLHKNWDLEPHIPNPSDLAILQYTSGSTGEPRGVRVTHANLSHQLRFHQLGVRLGLDASICMWVPHYHDFGLHVGILGALWGNGSITMISPFSFLKRPALWADIIHRFHCTHSMSPNFGLELLVRKTTPEQRKEWDLSSLVCIGLGAEPILADTLDRFFDAFAVTGVRPEAASACYGLAEHVAGVTNDGVGRIRVDPKALREENVLKPSDATNASVLIGCGSPFEDISVKIVDPVTKRALSSGQVGEIWTDSPSKSEGYEGVEDVENNKIFQARTLPDDGYSYLRTGDLGALVDNELYITGRIKELIIVRGRNLYPTDIEAAARYSHEAVRPGGLAAIGVDCGEGTEELVLFVELSKKESLELAHEVSQVVRATVARGVPSAIIHTVVIGRRGLVPKTSSGKVQRTRCQQMFKTPGFADHPKVVLLDEVSGTTIETEEVLEGENGSTKSLAVFLDIVSQAAGRPLPDSVLDRSPKDLGLSSIQLMEIGERLEKLLKEAVPAELLVSASTLRELAASLGLTENKGKQAIPRVLQRKWTIKPTTEALNSSNEPELNSVCLVGAEADVVKIDLQRTEINVKIGDLTDLHNLDGVDTVVFFPDNVESDPENAIEQCRTLAQKLAYRKGKPDVVVVTHERWNCDNSPIPAVAAIWGFIRTLQREASGRSWKIRDLFLLQELSPALLTAPEPELLVRSGEVYVPDRQSVKELKESASESWGGSGLLVGSDSPLFRRASEWLARNYGVEEMVYMLSEPMDKALETYVEKMHDAGLKITVLQGTPTNETFLTNTLDLLPSDDTRWVLHIGTHSGIAPAIRQTQGRIRKAFNRGWYGVRSLLKAIKQDSEPITFIAFSEGAGWFGPSGRAAWAASCAATQAEVERWDTEEKRALHISFGPRVGETPRRDVTKLWTPEGIDLLPNDGTLPHIDAVLADNCLQTALICSTRTTVG